MIEALYIVQGFASRELLSVPGRFALMLRAKMIRAKVDSI
jgi:hypothetical protein